MDPLLASLKVARSLLGMSCSGLLFEDGRVVVSGEIAGVEADDLSALMTHCCDTASTRWLDVLSTPSAPSIFSKYPQIACCMIEWLPTHHVRLFFFNDLPCALSEENIGEHVASLGAMLSGLLPSLPIASAHKKTRFFENDELLPFNDSLSVYLAFLDSDLRYRYVNQAYEKRFGLSKELILGKHVKDVVSADMFAVIENKLLDALQGNEVRFQYKTSQMADIGGRFNESSYIPRIEHGEVTGIYVCVQDVTPQRTTMQTLKRLHEVTANSALSLDEKLQKILKVGSDQFALPIGLISCIEGDVYTVKYSHTPNGEVLPGTEFELGNTYCVHTLSSDLPTSFFHTAISDIKEHPCYVNFGLEAYIGIVVYVRGRRWGTLNFSSPTPKTQPFSEDDYEVMKLLAQWVGNEMTLEQDRALQQQYENELKEQKIFFESLFVNAPEAIVLVGADRRVKMINPAFSELFGYQLDEIRGQSTQMLYAEERDFIKQGDAYDVTTADILNRYRASYIHKQGHVFHTETIGSQIRNVDGSLGGYIAHVRDVSERLEVEKKMIDTNLRLSIAADAAGIGVWELDLHTETLNWDDWMYRLYGTSQQAGLSPLDLWEECVYPEDKVRLRGVFQNLSMEGYLTSPEVAFISKELDFDFKIVRKDGQTRYLKSDAILVLDKMGHASHLIGVNMDVTSRKETEVLLREASQQALAASKAKSNFLATMSHEIRTPLNGVLGMAELLSGTSLNFEQREQLRVLQESGEGLLTLINDLLDFSKIEAGHLSIERVDFNLEKTLYDIVRMLVIKAEEKGIDLLVEYAENCPRFLVGDVFRIKQILTNLISNAIKFTNEGHVLVTVNGITNKQGQATLTIHVADTGVGIDKAVQPFLFNAFVQADSSTTRKFGGTGLGLAITKQLIALMQGEISLVSEPDVGSTFSVCLSLPVSHAISHIETVVNEDLLIGKKTLVIDDNETNLTILKNQLRSCDIYTDTEVDPVEALYRIKKAIDDGVPYQIVILDYMMPELDGLMLAKLIREASGSTLRPVILMTTSAGLISSEKLSDVGVNVNVAKPMTGVMLKKGLISALSTHVIGRQISYFDSKDKSLSGVEIQSDEPPKKRGLVLVVEDMRANMAVARGILERMGFDVLGAENGAIGVDMWKAHQPDFIFMDLHMPVMDGLSSMRHIRQAEKSTGRERVPILALTADVMSDTLAEVFRAGGDGLVPKPFKQQEFIAMLDKWFPRDRSPEVEQVDIEKVSAKTASMASAVAQIDTGVLVELKALLGNDFLLLLEAFYSDADQITASFSDMLKRPDEPDYDAIHKLAHSLKSVSLSVGARLLSSMAEQLEKESRQQDIPELSAKLRDIIDRYHLAKNELKKIVVTL
ncbi:hypothetical protein MACH16_13880 [Marinomonas pontica]|uniref:histidine kinase n=1 Tax=Marinomonas pontica TaxID=264739 RepID=A0ABM8FCP2_9GAMM|nr:hypothetical protein MACH16_13880 [Marinomonas pontica]